MVALAANLRQIVSRLKAYDLCVGVMWCVLLPTSMRRRRRRRRRRRSTLIARYPGTQAQERITTHPTINLVLKTEQFGEVRCTVHVSSWLACCV